MHRHNPSSILPWTGHLQSHRRLSTIPRLLPIYLESITLSDLTCFIHRVPSIIFIVGQTLISTSIKGTTTTTMEHQTFVHPISTALCNNCRCWIRNILVVRSFAIHFHFLYKKHQNNINQRLLIDIVLRMGHPSDRCQQSNGRETTAATTTTTTVVTTAASKRNQGGEGPLAAKWWRARQNEYHYRLSSIPHQQQLNQQSNGREKNNNDSSNSSDGSSIEDSSKSESILFFLPVQSCIVYCIVSNTT